MERSHVDFTEWLHVKLWSLYITDCVTGVIAASQR